MRNGEDEDYPYKYQDRRNYYGRRTTTNTNTNTNEDEANSYQQLHWLFRKRGRGKRGVTLAVTSFFVSVVILNGISSVYYQHSKMMRMLLLTSTTTQRNIHPHRNLNNEYDTDAPPPNQHRFRLTNNDYDSDSIIVITDINTTNINERIISPRNSNSNKINTLKTDTDTDDTTATSPTTTNTTVRPIATTIVIRTGNTTTTTTTTTTTKLADSIPGACDWLDDIDTHNTTDIFQCGYNKCAYHSTSSRRRRSGGDNISLIRYGYLVSDERNETFQKNQQGFGFAEHLTETFSIRHTLLEPPRRTDSEECNYRPIDKEFTDRLNGATFTNRHLKTFQPDRPLVIQPIELLPEGSILFKCDKSLYRKAKKNLRGDFTTVPLHVDFHEWEYRMRWDLNITKSMLESKEGECLEKDFQIVFDTSNGGIIHIDLDRCYQRRKRIDIWKDCQEKLISFTEKMIQIKRPK